MYTNRAYKGYDAAEVSAETASVFVGVSRTIQAQKEEADINKIVRNFGVTGRLPQNVRVPSYGDFTGVSDYREAIEAVRAAEASFAAMSSEVRNRFDNDPQKFLEFCEDARNLDEMRKIGLAVPLPDSQAASA